jgi:predicted dehydrogenase
MNVEKVFFVGLGGAGQRHLRIFKDLLPAKTEFSAYRSIRKTPLLNSNFTVNNDQTIEIKYGLKLFSSLEEGLDNNPDMIVISTPSSLHYDVARKAAERKIHIFIEKPFSHNLDGFEEFKEIVLQNNLCFIVSFQRRFHFYLKKIKEIISNGDLGKIISASFNVASYVPEWHTYENYKELYACRQDLGGGVLLTEIHELDLCYWYFGAPESVYCSGGNYSNEKLDVEDTVHVTLKYKGFSVQVNLCFMQKHNRRDLYIAGTKGYVEWNQDGNRLLINDYETGKEEVLSEPEYTNDAMFYAQASYFLETFSCTDNKAYLEAAHASLAIVEAAKKVMKQGSDVKLPSMHS